MKKFLSILFILFAFCAASASAAARIPVYRVDGAFLFFDKSTGEITGFAGEPTVLSIPSSVGGYEVTSIGAEAFANCTTLTSVTIPPTVTHMGDGAFKNCSALSSVTFSGTIENVPLNAFDATPWATGAHDEFVIAGKTLLLRYNGTAENIVVPDGVRKIAPNAFAYNATIKSVTLPEGLIEIGDNAFVHCYSLSDISFPTTLSSVGLGAFDDTIWMRTNTDEFVSINGILVLYNGDGGCVTIPEGITTVASGVFMSNDKLTAVALPDTIRTVNEAAFARCPRLSAAVIPSGVEQMDDYAFYGSDNVVIFGESGSYAEYYAERNSIVFSNPVTVSAGAEAADGYIIDGIAYVPLRSVFEELGFEIEWAKNGTILVESDETLVSARLNSSVVTVGSDTADISAPLVLIKDKTYVPAKVFGELFGISTEWDASSRTIYMSRGQ